MSDMPAVLFLTKISFLESFYHKNILTAFDKGY